MEGRDKKTKREVEGIDEKLMCYVRYSMYISVTEKDRKIEI